MASARTRQCFDAWFLATATVLLFSGPAGATEPVFFEPLSPTDNDLVRVIVAGNLVGALDPQPTSVEVEGDIVTVHAEAAPLPYGISPPPVLFFAFSAELGPLDPGSYEVRILISLGDTTPPLIWSVADLDVSAGPQTVSLRGGDYEVLVNWTDFEGASGTARVVPGRASSDSALFYFFDDRNWELLVKILDGCGSNGYTWVFSSAATNVEYTILVTEVDTGRVWEYANPLGASSPPVTDIFAFECL